MARVKTFRGCFFLAPVDDAGNLTGKWTSPGEAYPLTVSFKEEVTKIMGNTCETRGKIIATMPKPGEAGGSLTLHEYTVENVAKAMKGMVSTRNVSSTTITAKPVVLGKFGEFSEIGNEDLSDVVVKDETDTTTYTAGTDYSIEPVLGLISPISGGAIAEDATVHVTASCAANSDKRLAIGAGVSRKYAIKGKMIDNATEEVCKLYLRKVLLTAKNDVVFASDIDTEKETLEFDLVPELPTGQTDYGYIDGLPV